jgi:quercetin dioxygenase-like cupin family protein
MSQGQAKRGISIYPAADAGAKDDFRQLSEEQLAPVLLAGEAFRLGGETKVLVRDAGGFTLVHVWFKPNFPLPRHSHNADCMYYVISGSAVMGARTLRAGDSFFVPADAPYRYTAGPEGIEILEVYYRTHHTDMVCYGDPSDYQRTAAAAVEANRPVWTSLTTSPTFATDRGD